MLEIIEDVFRPAGEGPPAWPEGELQAVVEMESPALLANASENGLTAEFPYRGTELAMNSGARGESLESVLFQASLTQPHPQMGNGCLCTLTLPVNTQDPSLVNTLNLRELNDESICPVLGSWTHHDNSLSFVTFLPNGVYLPGLLSILYLRSALRAQWASTVLDDLVQ